MLSWLLSESRAAEVRELLGGAELVLASSLTLIECERALIRVTEAGALAEAGGAERRGLLRRTVEHWVLFDLDAEIVERACQPFPREPIRTLDVVHLATAVLAQRLVADLAILSLDHRLRGSGRGMGFRVLPEGES